MILQGVEIEDHLQEVRRYYRPQTGVPQGAGVAVEKRLIDRGQVETHALADHEGEEAPGAVEGAWSF